jgi:hypothetical protein
MIKKTIGLVFIIALAASFASAAALTAARDTKAKSNQKINIGVKTNTTIYAGAIVAVDSTGYAINAADVTNIVVLGRAASTVVSTGVASGAKVIDVEQGCFWYAADAVSKDKFKIGSDLYVVDNQTLSTTNIGTYSIKAGPLVDYDAVLGQVAVKLGK